MANGDVAQKSAGIGRRGVALSAAGVRELAPALLLGLWALGELAVAIVRPGELLELSLIAVAGVVAWPLVVDRPARPASIALGAAAFATPLLATWPAQTFTTHLGFSAPAPLALLAPASLLVLVAAALVLREGAALTRAPLLAAGGAALLLLGGAIASAAAAHPQAALADWWVTLAIPIGFGALVALRVRTADLGWRLLLTTVAAALVPAAVGIAAYIVEFGVPHSGDDLVLAKQILVRPFLFQQLTFGNVGHVADFALLLLPAAALGMGARRVPLLARAAAGATTIALTAVVVFAMSRAALVLAGAGLFAATCVLVFTRRQRVAVVAAIGLALVGATFSSGATRSSVAGLRPGAKAPPTFVFPTTGGKPVKTAPTTPAGPSTVVPGTKIHVTDPSEAMRVGALRAGVDVFKSYHTPFGVGAGQYPRYDPVHTAPHSLALLVLAEDGVIGLAGLGVLILFLVVEGLLVLRRLRRDQPSVDLLRMACLGGTLLYLVHGLGAGAPLTLGTANVWSMVFWLQVGIVAGLRAAPPERADAA